MNVLVHVVLAAHGQDVALYRLFAEAAPPVEVAVGGERLVVVRAHLPQR